MSLLIEWTQPSLLHSQIEQWTELAHNTVQPNPFYEPDFLIASQKHLEPSNTIRTAVVWQTTNDQKRMVGLFPTRNSGITEGFLRPCLSLYRNRYVYSTTPLIHRDLPERVWEAFIEGVRAEPDIPDRVYLPINYDVGPSHKSLQNALDNLGLSSCKFDQFPRPVVNNGVDFDTYFNRLSKNRRKSLRRRSRQIEEAGDVRFEMINRNHPDFPAMLAEFLRIENAGWKNKKGSSLAYRPSRQKFAEHALNGERCAPEVQFDALRYNGAFIAININLIRNGQIFAFKSAFDEDHYQLAPGILLDMHLASCTLNDERYKRLDSCASKDHYLRDLWLDHDTVGGLIFSASPNIPADQLECLANARTRFKSYRDAATSLLQGASPK